MHAPNGRAIRGILVIAIAVTMGCRGSNPFNRYVEVSKTADPDMPEIEAPPQRLATAKPRTSEDTVSPHRPVASSTKPGTLADPSQETSPAAGGQMIAATTVSSRSPSKPSVKSAAESKTRETAAVASLRDADPPTNAAASKSVDHVAAQGPAESQTLVGGIASDVTSDELMAALNDFPPELRQQALRQFVAAAARSADQTSQPNTLIQELAKSIQNLPTLPEPTSREPAVLPQRIGSEEGADQPATATLSDSVAVSKRSDSSGASASLTDLQASELQSVEVQTISDSAEPRTGSVKTASAAREANQDSMVSQAVADRAAASKASDEVEPSEQVVQTAPQSERELIAELVQRLSTAVPDESEAERSSRLIKLRHLMVLAGDPDSAVAQIEGMAEAEQEYLRHHLLGLWTMIDPQGHPIPSRRFTTAIPQIREAAKFAAAATDSLEVRSLAFCTEIESYGQITPFSGNRFNPGQQVILYCEIENFTVKKVDAGYETHLQGSYDVYDGKNEKVFSQVLPADQQVSANYLRDYFIAYQMYLPSELSPGTYRLQLTMEDANGKKYGQSSIPFEIAK